jgi:hypothetical protein
MSFDEANDDYGLAKTPFRVIACLAVDGRLPLLRYTIERLYQKNGCYKVICAGDRTEDRKLCEEMGAVWVPSPNRPLGKKWNKSFQEAAKYNPDACLFMGSSDWLSDNWVQGMIPYLENYDLIGVPGCHFLHLAEESLLCHWKGYTNGRAGESIGIGRVLSRTLLDHMKWKPFSDMLNNSLDHSMQHSALQRAANIHLVDSSELIALSISTNHWIQKHQFWDHYSGRISSTRIYNVEEFLSLNFPEAKCVLSKLTSQKV